MTDLFHLNAGGATRPGARAVVHPGAEDGEYVVMLTVVAETDRCIVLDDGFTYDKRTGTVISPLGSPMLQRRVAVTEGSAMFACWMACARRRRRSSSTSYRPSLRWLKRARERRSVRSMVALTGTPR